MGQSPLQAAPPAAVEEYLPLNATDSQAVAGNYIDCTESNDEDGGDEEEENDEKGDGDVESREETMDGEKIRETEENQINDHPQSPKWEDFFTTEKLPNSQNSLNSINSQKSQSCCSATSPALSRMTDSQTPELFSEAEEETEGTSAMEQGFSLTLSASLSNHSSQNQDSELADTVILPPEEPDGADWKTPRQSVRSDLDELPGSQGSSDFEIPRTPESKPPRPEELFQLYQKLAAGEELIIGKRAQ